jgi:hypothetical protein
MESIFYKPPFITSSEYTNQKKQQNQIKYIYSKPHNKSDPNFQINYNNMQIKNYNNYESFLNVSKAFQTYSICPQNISCNTPLSNINDYQHSYIDNKKQHILVKNCNINHCDCYNLINNTTKCTNQYTHAVNNNVNIDYNYQFPSNIFLQNKFCLDSKKSNCETLPYCNNTTHYGGCNCSNYNITFPTPNEFITYTQNNDPNCLKKNNCVETKQIQMDAFSMNPVQLFTNNCFNKVSQINQKCSISSKMQNIQKQSTTTTSKFNKNYNNCIYKTGSNSNIIQNIETTKYKFASKNTQLKKKNCGCAK